MHEDDSGRDYAIAEIRSGSKVIKGVPCWIKLPARVDGEVAIRLEPPRDAFSEISGEFQFELHAKRYLIDGSPLQDIVSEKTYITNASQFSDGRFVVDASPNDLLIKYRHRRRDPGGHAGKIYFWVSRNAQLDPHKILWPSGDGSITVEGGQSLSCKVEKYGDVKFDTHYRSEDDGDVLRQWNHLVAELPYSEPSLDRPRIDDLARTLEDLLAVATFGSSEPTLWMGWELVTPETTAVFYRRDISIPKGPSQSVARKAVVLRGFDEFLANAYRSFAGSPSRELIKRAIWSSVGTHDAILSLSYMSMFSALEALAFSGRNRELNDPQAWLELKRRLRAAISQCPEVIKKDLIHRQLGSLNRIPFTAVWDEFVREQGLVLDDLWPMFDDGKGRIGLYEIRNKLAHGEIIQRGMHRGLSGALSSLEITLKRTILRLLNWPIDDSQVSPEVLKENWSAVIVAEAIRKDQECLRRGWPK